MGSISGILCQPTKSLGRWKEERGDGCGLRCVQRLTALGETLRSNDITVAISTCNDYLLLYNQRWDPNIHSFCFDVEASESQTGTLFGMSCYVALVVAMAKLG